MGIKKVDAIWLDGSLVPWDSASEHLLAHTMHYGVGAFEGVRAYQRADGRTHIFRLREHIERLLDSCAICTMECTFSRDALMAACLDVVRANKMPSCYLRPLVFLGYGALGLGSLEPPVRTMVACYEWGAYLGDEGLKAGIRAKISSWQRVGPNVIPHAAKATGVYVNSMLAVTEANRAGYDEAILLTAEGYVADGSGENVFIVKDGELYTPDLSTSILPGITRDTVIQIAQDLGYRVHEKALIRSDLYLADEAFMTGTAAEVTPLRSVDDVEIGVGPITLEIQEAYLDTARGRSERWAQWLEYATPAPAEA